MVPSGAAYFLDDDLGGPSTHSGWSARLESGLVVQCSDGVTDVVATDLAATYPTVVAAMRSSCPDTEKVSTSGR